MLKTRKSVAKRFHFTGKGKIKFKRSNLRHILTDKQTTQKRRARKTGYLFSGDRWKIERSLPFGNVKK